MTVCEPYAWPVTVTAPVPTKIPSTLIAALERTVPAELTACMVITAGEIPIV